ncbi:MAG: hypothetical protein K2Y32_16245 [Candidatus Obscuribacterales bacterium]|nr:hypothetical protein [Candidatus Obscuribacterales bacterium]
MYTSFNYRGRVSSSSGFACNENNSISLGLPPEGELTITVSHRNKKDGAIEFTTQGSLQVIALAPDFIKLSLKSSKDCHGSINIKHENIELTCLIEPAQ